MTPGTTKPGPEQTTPSGPDPSGKEKKGEAAEQATARAFKGKFTMGGGQPLKISEEEPARSIEAAELPTDHRLIRETLKARRDAGKALLEGRYSHLQELAPPQVRGDCDCLAIVCDDGIIVRYDRRQNEKPKLRIGTVQEELNTVSALAPKLSEGYVYRPAEIVGFELPADGPKVALSKTDAVTGERSEIAGGQIAIVVPWGEVKTHALGNKRPVPLVSITNEATVQIEGEMFDAESPAVMGTGQQFVLRSRVKLPVGWETFEVYPPFDAAVWQASTAAMWAELDLLAAAAQRNIQEQQFHAIDPRAAARKQFALLLREFGQLLGGPEAPLQSFLEDHPELLSPSHTRVWRKLKIGANITDFVFREASNDYLLVEIEAPKRTLFRKNGQPHGELVHAISQVTDWLRYIEDNLATVQRELGLTGISVSPSSLIVIGRSEGLTNDDRRRLTTLQNQSPKLRIFTYDDLLATAKANVENMLGTLWDTEGSAEVFYLPRK